MCATSSNARERRFNEPRPRQRRAAARPGAARIPGHRCGHPGPVPADAGGRQVPGHCPCAAYGQPLCGIRRDGAQRCKRYFGIPGAPIERAAVDGAAGDAQTRRNPFWSTPRGAPLIRDLADVSVTFGAGQASSHHQAFSSSSDGKPFSQAPLVNHATLGLQARGIYRANISVPLVDLPEGLQSYTPFDEIDLRITRHTSVLIDPWAARSVQQNMERFGKLAPLNSVFSSMETLLDVAIPAFELFGEVPAPRFGHLQPWQDAVPADRLKPEY